MGVSAEDRMEEEKEEEDEGEEDAEEEENMRLDRLRPLRRLAEERLPRSCRGAGTPLTEMHEGHQERGRRKVDGVMALVKMDLTGGRDPRERRGKRQKGRPADPAPLKERDHCQAHDLIASTPMVVDRDSGVGWKTVREARVHRAWVLIATERVGPQGPFLRDTRHVMADEISCIDLPFIKTRSYSA